MRKLAALIVVLFLVIGSGLIGSSTSVGGELTYVRGVDIQTNL